jgi:hypothetical protein
MTQKVEEGKMCIYFLKFKIYLNHIYRFNSCLTENTLCIRKAKQWVLYKENVALLWQSYVTHAYTACLWNAELWCYTWRCIQKPLRFKALNLFLIHTKWLLRYEITSKLNNVKKHNSYIFLWMRHPLEKKHVKRNRQIPQYNRKYTRVHRVIHDCIHSAGAYWQSEMSCKYISDF